MSGIIGGVIDFNNKRISENLKDSMIETINLYKVDNIDYILRNNYLMVSGQIFITEENKSELIPLRNNELILVCDAILDNRKELIEIDNKAVIFTRDRGVGKSTLTTALREKGYKFISDNVAGIKIDKVPYVMPGFPYQKLCESAMDKFGYDKEKNTSFMSDKEVKYVVPALDEFVYEGRELVSIVKLTVVDVEEVTIEELRGSEKLNNIIENIYRGEYIKHLGKMDPIYFKQCVDIAKNINFYVVTRPKDKFTVDEQIELIEDKIELIQLSI